MKKINKRIELLLLILLLAPTYLLAQYPIIPEEEQKQGEMFMDKVKQHNEAVWKKALPIVEKEAREGRPYIPWAGIP